MGVGWRHRRGTGRARGKLTRGALLGAFAALLVGAAACSSGSDVRVVAPGSSASPPGTEATPTPDTPEPTPAVGDCHGAVDSRLIDAPSDPRPAVSCSDPHGMETFYVGEMDPSITVWPGDQNDTTLAEEIDQACTTRHLQYLGVDASTLASLPPDRLQVYAYYIPTKADFAAGARWYRCDALVAPVDSNRPTTISGTLKDVYANPLPAAYRLCGANLGRTAGCDDKHEIEYLASVLLPDVVAYPAQRDDLRVAAACRPALLSALGLTEERPDLAFGYLLPSQDQWDQGLHGATCVVGTKDSEQLDGTLAGIGPTNALPLAS